MTLVKNLAGLLIVFGGFAFMFIISGAMAVLGISSFGSDPLFTAIGLVGIVGAVISGWVIILFFKNFRWGDVAQPDHVAKREDAPVMLEVKYDDSKSRLYLLDSRESPRQSNPKKLGRGVFLLQKKRGQLSQDKTAITLVSPEGSRIKNIRDFDKKLYFDFKDSGENHVLEITSITEVSVNFEKPEPESLPLSNHSNSKEKLAEHWADTLKKAS